jgi:hypothetical protein
MQQTDGYVNEMEARYLPSRAVGGSRNRYKGEEPRLLRRLFDEALKDGCEQTNGRSSKFAKLELMVV